MILIIVNGLIVNDNELRCKGLRDSWEKEVKRTHDVRDFFLSLIHRGGSMTDPGDIFAVITYRSICRHTTCGPIINAERYVTYALIMSPCRNIQDTPSVGQRYAALAKKRVGNICGICACLAWHVYVMRMLHASVPPCARVRCPVPKLLRPSLSDETSWRIALALHWT